ncbi:MAG: sulfotransferase [Chloroflexota bacterium]
MAHPIRYVTLAATVYSGSTLFARLMNAHPQVVSVGELSNVIGRLFRTGRIQAYSCSCGVEIEQCSFWVDVQRRCAAKGTPLDLHDFDTDLDTGLGPLVNRFLFGASGGLVTFQRLVNLGLTRHIGTVRDCIDRTLSIAESALSVDGAHVFVDTSKSVARVPFLLQRRETDLVLVHLTRDPRGFVNSYLKHKCDEASVRNAVSYWRRTHRSAMMLGHSLGPVAYRRIQYEELCRHPRRVFSELFDLLGLPDVDVVEAARSHAHHLVGNGVRLRPFDGIHLDSSWQRQLTPAQMEACVRHAGHLAASLGYARHP